MNTTPPSASPADHAPAAPCGSFPPAVLRPAELPAFQRGGGVSTTPLVTRAVGAQVFLNGITLFGPGTGIPPHTHDCAESVVVLEGDAVVEIDGTEHRLSPYDTTYVAAGTPHRFRNASTTAPLRILWTYASVDATRTIVATGATARVDAEHTRPAEPETGTGGKP
ncbi:cupin domain-containing protein [Streptomyces sp. NRRL WC-3744]|uniref:cupin domain-containing protein n=1 Tax=Streptomyces sp. NRRL WC-3744 TaxID=1463935 RepID=UPI00066478E8|nr:cupin domain-containing protein [Streptomyces sp. NRRL WC-3744]